MGFRKDFVWGVATAAFQIEGSADKRGACVWDEFCKTPGKVYDMHNGDIACDHYNRFKEDAGIIKEIGARAYRFSVSWPRVLPDGTGKINQAGLDFYDSLVDELLENGIEPYATLFHWDFPYELYKKGGWLNRDSADWFSEYVHLVVERLSDRVKYWMTQNEPQCYIGNGHSKGEHAPGLKLPWKEVLLAGHHSMLAHGKSVIAIRQASKQKPVIGYAPTGSVKIPFSDEPRDVEAARHGMFDVNDRSMFITSLLLDPVLLGRYPEDAFEAFKGEMPEIKQGDMETMHQPVDFLGFNIYNGSTVKAGEDGKPVKVIDEAGHAETAMGWPVTPKALYWGPKFLIERYKLPLYITENGMANLDWVSRDGSVNDPQRIDFLGRYIAEYRRLADEGADLRGYFHWSLMDNFEWALGYSKRFGLVYVDYNTGERIIKKSGYWYKKVIESNGDNLDY